MNCSSKPEKINQAHLMLAFDSWSGHLNTVTVDTLETKHYCTLDRFTESTYRFVLDYAWLSPGLLSSGDNTDLRIII